jgi:hypothetical protein
VRHRRRPLLAAAERLLDLANFRPGEVADLERETVERRGEDGERREQLSMPVALQDLGGYRRRLEPERLAGDALHIRWRTRVCPDGAGELPDPHAGERVLEPIAVAPELKRPAQEL